MDITAVFSCLVSRPPRSFGLWALWSNLILMVWKKRTRHIHSISTCKFVPRAQSFRDVLLLHPSMLNIYSDASRYINQGSRFQESIWGKKMFVRGKCKFFFFCLMSIALPKPGFITNNELSLSDQRNMLVSLLLGLDSLERS